MAYKKYPLKIQMSDVIRWKSKIKPPNTNQKQTGTYILISDKLDCRANTIIRERNCHFIKVINQENISILNVCTSTTRA